MSWELVLFAIASLGVPIAVLVIFLYLRASFELLDLVRRRETELWHLLGKPERVWVRQMQGGFHTIRPLGPWISWVWSGSSHGLKPEVAAGLARARQLLRAGIVSLAAAMGAILLLVLVASPVE